MKNSKPRLSISIILPLLIAFCPSCGNLDDFKSSNYKPVSVAPNGLAALQEGVSIPYDNLGVDAIVINIPQTKTQSDSVYPNSTSGSIKFYDNNSSKKPSDNLSIMLPSHSDIGDDTESFLREKENFFLAEETLSGRSSFSRAQKAAKSYAVGDTWGPIKVIKSLGNSDVTEIIAARCLAVTDEAYIFSAINVTADEAAIEAYSSKFKTIYDSVHRNFGSETDTDGNGKIIVLIFDMGNDSTLGYFYAADKYPSSQVIDSNEADIIYLNSRFAYKNDQYNTILSTIAHEMQHMVYFDIKYAKITNRVSSAANYKGDSWLNEGLSMLSEHFAGYNNNVDGWIKRFLNGNYAGLSLTHWSATNYGFSGLFVRYIYDKTTADIAKSIYNTGFGGIKAVENVMGKDFNTIFDEFFQTVYLSSVGEKADPNYNFSSVDLSKFKLAYFQPSESGEIAFAIKPYGVTFFKNNENTEKLYLSKPLKGYLAIK